MLYSVNTILNPDTKGGLNYWQVVEKTAIASIFGTKAFKVSPNGRMVQTSKQHNFEGVVGGYQFGVKMYISTTKRYLTSPQIEVKYTIHLTGGGKRELIFTPKVSSGFIEFNHEVLLGKLKYTDEETSEEKERYYLVDDIEDITVEVINNNQNSAIYLIDFKAVRMIDDKATLSMESDNPNAQFQERLIFMYNNHEKTIETNDLTFSKTLNLMSNTHVYFDVLVTGSVDKDDILEVEVEVNNKIYHLAKLRIFSGWNTQSLSVTAPSLDSGNVITDIRLRTSNGGRLICSPENIQISIKAYGLLNDMGTSPNFTVSETYDISGYIRTINFRDFPTIQVQTPIPIKEINDFAPSTPDINDELIDINTINEEV